MSTDRPSAQKDRVGFVGLGIMGLPMATNLLDAGYELTVHSRTRERAKPLELAGATFASSPAEVARRSDVLITMLPDSPDVATVAQGPDGLFAEAPAGLVWVDMSSIAPAVARSLAEEARALGIGCLDAPVSGGELGAIAGTLSIMVGGPEELFERCRSIFERLGSSIVRVGDSGAGQVAKVCNQMIVGVTIAAVAEALVLGAKAGVDPTMIREALLGGFAQSRILDVHGRRMLEKDFAPGFRVTLHAKDLGNALDAARTYTASAPLTATVSQLFNSLAATGAADLDHSSLALAYEAQAAHRLDDG